MADIVIQAVVRKIADVAGNLVMQEGSRLSTVKENIDWIESEMKYIQSYLEDADAKQGGDRAVATLVKDILGLGLDVEDIIDTYFPKIAASPQRKGFVGRLRNASGIFSYIYTARNFSAEIEAIKTRVNEINRRRLTYRIQEKSGSGEGGMWDARRSFPHVDEPNVVGFDKHIEELVARMLGRGGSQCGVISITGMPGLGKTTLAKKVYNSVLQSFECSAWICVSQQPNITELLRDIARQVGMAKDKWEHNTEPNLFTFLRHKRYVIVIDDIWQIEAWDALKIGIPNNFESGSRIMLTSRNRDVGVYIGGTSSLYELQPLDQENSKSLFFNMVRGLPTNMRETSDPPQLENIGEQILEKCGGVPLAIVLTASMLLLRERTEHAWKGVLESMGQEEDQYSRIFSLSYKDLPTNLKPCFLYFALYSEDYQISAFEIINFWAAEGFIRGNAVQEVEDVGMDYLKHLIARNLIQVTRRKFDGRIKSLGIHDILHSLCVRVAKEIDFFNTHNDLISSNSTMRVRRVTTYDSSLLEGTCFNISRTPKLRAMICESEENWNGPKKKHFKKCFRDLRFLRVLSLQFGLHENNLPSEIGNLNHLTYLQLRVCGCVRLPSTINNLRSLLTFDARESYGRLIIPDCIWKLKQLRHVLLPKHCEVIFDSVKFHPLETSDLNLQSVYGFRFFFSPSMHCFPKFTSLRKLGVDFYDNEFLKVKELLDAITISHKLEILQLEGHNLSLHNIYNIADLNLSRFENLFRLHLKGFAVNLPDHDKLPQNLTKLSLEHTYLEKDPMETLRKLPKLETLILGLGSYTGKKMMVCSGGGGLDTFRQLQVLDIFFLYNLEELMVEDEMMPRLIKLILTYRPRTTVPDRIRNIMIFNGKGVETDNEEGMEYVEEAGVQQWFT